MNSYHCQKRYCERFLGMTDDKKIKNYLNDNKNKDYVNKEIDKILLEAKHVYTGSIRDYESQKFYINDNICIIAGESNDTVITLYKIDYGFGETIDKKIINDLLKDLNKIYKKIDRTNNKVQNNILKKETEIESINQEIKILEKQLELLKNKKNSLIRDIDNFHSEINYQFLEAEKIVTKMVYCINYKLDFEMDNKNKTVA